MMLNKLSKYLSKLLLHMSILDCICNTGPTPLTSCVVLTEWLYRRESITGHTEASSLSLHGGSSGTESVSQDTLSRFLHLSGLGGSTGTESLSQDLFLSLLPLN